MNPGSLNKKIEFLKLTQVPDGGGGYEDVLVPVKSVWANFKPVAGREFYQAQQAQAQITHKVTIRFSNEIDRSLIIQYKGKKYDIQHLIDVNEQQRFIEMSVLERQ